MCMCVDGSPEPTNCSRAGRGIRPAVSVWSVCCWVSAADRRSLIYDHNTGIDQDLSPWGIDQDLSPCFSAACEKVEHELTRHEPTWQIACWTKAHCKKWKVAGSSPAWRFAVFSLCTCVLTLWCCWVFHVWFKYVCRLIHVKQVTAGHATVTSDTVQTFTQVPE